MLPARQTLGRGSTLAITNPHPPDVQASAVAPPARTPHAEAVALRWQRRLALEKEHGALEGEEEYFHHWIGALEKNFIAWCIKAVGMWERGRANARRIQHTEHTLHVPGWPRALDGFSLLHLSDLHFSRVHTDVADAIVAALDGLEADLAVFTGDYRFGFGGPVDHVYPRFEQILAGLRLRHTPIAILGNHDVSVMVEPLRALGLHVFVNQGQLFDFDGAPVWFGGVDDPHYDVAVLSAALHGAPEGVPRVLLSHTPELAAEAAAQGVGLYLCGHTHGGQLCLPGGRPVRLNVHRHRNLYAGPWQVAGMAGHTTRGLGVTDLPVRYHCPPEAVRLTLRSAP